MTGTTPTPRRFTAEEMESSAEHFGPRLAAMLRQGAQDAERLTWQPIATAPKDGTKIMLFAREHGIAYWTCGGWFKGDDGSHGWLCSSFLSDPDGNWTAYVEPTHWARILAAPLTASDVPEAPHE